ncbi:ATP-binding protein [Pseudovibrio exalbescens]|uniref:sensor histidine kinase n=1 Tax=Pseudovibrio exalbescens TaxID=197461 RepID=UPI002365EBBE|nr:ATP-binding protein [Pseudovibrio exalbescens]MDD7909162.1 ATP-binding protein [Pseudovibrio exalbescens]
MISALAILIGAWVAGISLLSAALIAAAGFMEPVLRRDRTGSVAVGCVSAIAFSGVVASKLLGAPATSLDQGGWQLLVFAQGLLIGLRMAWAHRHFRTELETQAATENLHLQKTREAFCLFSAEGEIRYTSNAFSRVLHWGGGMVTARGLFQRLHSDDRHLFLKAQTENCATGTPQQVRVRTESDHGETRYYLVEFSRAEGVWPAAYHASQKAYFVDVTFEHRHRVELDRQIDTLKDQLALRNNGVALACHEIKTPLNAIVGFSELLLNANNYRIPENTQREYLELIGSTGRHMATVTDHILDLAHLEAGELAIELSEFELEACLDQCVSLLRPTAQEGGIDLNLDLAADLGAVLADPTAVQQILTNLLSNAVKFTRKGGAVTVSATRSPDLVSIQVSDTGIGIDEEDLPHVCEPFVQAKSARLVPNKGNGLGLALAKQLTERQGGQFQINSRKGQGTCVVVRLPVTHEAMECDPSHETVELPEKCVA